MKALVLNCTLKGSPETSNTEALARVMVEANDEAKMQRLTSAIVTAIQQALGTS